MQDVDLQRRVAAVKNEILHAVSQFGSGREFVEEVEKSEALAYFLVQAARDRKYLRIDGKQLFRSLVAGAWAASSGAFGDPYSAALGIVWALAELDALKADINLIDGDRARVLGTIYRLSADKETASVSRIAEELELAEDTVKNHAEWLCANDIVREADGDYFLAEWRVAIPDPRRPTAGSNKLERDKIANDDSDLE